MMFVKYLRRSVSVMHRCCFREAISLSNCVGCGRCLLQRLQQLQQQQSLLVAPCEAVSSSLTACVIPASPPGLAGADEAHLRTAERTLQV